MTSIHDEIRLRLGLVPNFFRLAPQSPDTAMTLWQSACSNYLDNPLPSLFKERLFVWLSRFCEVRYCIARHLAYMIGLGRIAGDASCQPQSIEDMMRLLQRPVPRNEALRAHVSYCAGLRPDSACMPVPDSKDEQSIFACATHVFLRSSSQSECLDALHRALGATRLEYLLLLLNFVHAEHDWSMAHPGLVFDDDVIQLLTTHRALSRCLLDDPEVGAGRTDQSHLAELSSQCEEKRKTIRESEGRLAQELHNSRLLHDISNELICEQDITALHHKLVEAASSLMRSPCASMQELFTNPNGVGELKLLSHKGFIPEAAAFWDRVHIDSGSSCGVALASGKRIVVPDVERCEFMAGTEDLHIYLETGIHSVQTTPLFSRGGTLVGAISTHWHTPHMPSDHELELFDILARQAADLIERTKAEDALRSSEARCRRALQPQNIGVIFFDTEGRITEANDAFLSMSGYSREELTAHGMHWNQMTPPEWKETTEHAMQELWTRGSSMPYEKEYVRKDGSRWWALLGATQLSESEGVKFIIDITKRKQAEQALRNADQRKDEFLATLAHELRNPLAPISNAMHLLRRPDGRRTADKLMEIVDRQVRQIVHLVDDLLDISRITNGKIALKKTPVALSDVVRNAVDTSGPLIEQAGHRLSMLLPADEIVLEADALRLTQVLTNLLSNAAKYTNHSGHIWLTAAQADDRVSITVRDDGIGIPQDQLTWIFDPFAQAHRDTFRSQGGLGIGLCMVRRLVEMHGGTVEAHSDGPGRGSEFVVHLPLADGDMAA
ncbi:sensor histidine kinase [Noviherbaspirillum pedocola]|uniref:histidine kinase n=1 Tax=Noviherbaspirillum pedocola TaxID=2801341 RepID=A0A934W7P4_9BURK|nr:ATP-binding protein [Noviherbaspirillum pedocola]MBK4736615.1 PAS domain S-box protein [Noviherbaspirillum pedocola]